MQARVEPLAIVLGAGYIREACQRSAQGGDKGAARATANVTGTFHDVYDIRRPMSVTAAGRVLASLSRDCRFACSRWIPSYIRKPPRPRESSSSHHRPRSEWRDDGRGTSRRSAAPWSSHAPPGPPAAHGARPRRRSHIREPAPESRPHRHGGRQWPEPLAAHDRLRDAAYHWARVAAQRDSASRATYQALRRRGRGHARSLRSVADRLLKIACAMLRSMLLSVRLAPSKRSPCRGHTASRP